MAKMTPDGWQNLQQVKPLIRSVGAFLVYLRFGGKIDDAYKDADKFIATLERDSQ